MDCSSKVASPPRTAAFPSSSSPLTTTKNPAGGQCKPALSHSWASLLAPSSYSKVLVQAYGPTNEVRKRCDHVVVEMNISSISHLTCSCPCLRGASVEPVMENVSRVASGAQGYVEGRFEEIVGRSPALESVLEQIERVAPTDSTVLIQGETGTGKELIAQAIHSISRRYDHTYVKLNCAAIPFDLLESELFGHEKGAFTGAVAQKIGRFEMADTGTLFLDEIGDLPLALQPKLLRILQEHEFERLGSGRTHQIDVRLVAATHCDLAEMVVRSEFRSDLYYRLNVFPVLVPPLRERREDIRQLVLYFVELFGRRMGKRIDPVPQA